MEGVLFQILKGSSCTLIGNADDYANQVFQILKGSSCTQVQLHARVHRPEFQILKGSSCTGHIDRDSDRVVSKPVRFILHIVKNAAERAGIISNPERFILHRSSAAMSCNSFQILKGSSCTMPGTPASPGHTRRCVMNVSVNPQYPVNPRGSMETNQEVTSSPS